MIKKITLLILGILLHLCGYSQSEDEYNSFSTRTFMKFNNFLVVPTFSLLHSGDTSIEAITRSSNIEFEDASRLHVLSYSGKMRENVGAGIAVFQQEVGVFKDFGALANYAYQMDLNKKTKLTFGFNFFYSRRGIDNGKVLSNTEDPVLSNYQDKPVVVFQPAVTVSFGSLDVGVFFENIGDFDLKANELVTPFADKTISAHAAYTYKLGGKGLMEKAIVRGLAIGKRSKADGFTYAGNVLVDLPKAGWLKVGYDKLFGMNAGFGINLNQRLSIGFAYEKQENLSATNEVGLIYKLGRQRYRRTRSEISTKTPKVSVILPEDPKPDAIIPSRKVEDYEDPEHGDLANEIKMTQDSIRILRKKLDEVLNSIKKNPESNPTTKDQSQSSTTPPSEVRDKTLPRSKETPWRNQTVSRRAGGGTMYYVAIDQFKDVNKAKDLVKRYYKKRKIRARYVRDPKFNSYVVYVERYGKREDAEEKVDEVNGGKKGFEDDKSETGVLQIETEDKSAGKDNVYVMRITLGPKGELIKEKKPHPRARVRSMTKVEGLEEGYYMVVNVYSRKDYADKFLDELENDGINAGYFLNPETGYRHVYIVKTQDREEIIRLYNNNLNGTYYDNKSIIHIK